MPAAIKNLVINTTIPVVLYTCPASRSAKVILSAFSLYCGAPGAGPTLAIGMSSYSNNASTVSSASFNTSFPVTPPTVPRQESHLVHYLAPGQTISTAITVGYNSSVTAQILIIEEVAS